METLTLENDGVELTIAREFGPRITRFAEEGGPNAFAELGDLGIPLDGGGQYTLRGGHRLWAAPEVPATTYEPDDLPVEIVTSTDGAEIRMPAGHAGIAKTITVSLDTAVATVDHALRNDGPAPVDVAPWAITQLPPGGTAIVPLALDPADPHRLQPNSKVVLWPYTGTGDTPFAMTDRLLLLDGDRRTATKIGVGLVRGWLAYVLDGLVFVKRATHVDNGRYLDLGASGQCYCNADFLELETLGEQVVLEPGETTTHRETWELHRVAPTVPPREIPQLLNLDGGPK